jgi:site-specific DNA-methyltransferase (adenine-specific)
MWLYGEGFPKGLDISKAIDKKLGAKRKAVGTKPTQHRGVRADHRYGFQPPGQPLEITIPSTPEAELWDGYGTALKPAWEPVLVAMKPREGSFANNALTWGCGGLNIRGSRIGGTVTTNPLVRNAKGYASDGLVQGSTGKGVVSEGRWPANVLLDEVAAELLDQQSPASKSRRSARRMYASNVGNGKTMKQFKSRLVGVGGYDDEGGPSRFFFCAKASRRERRGNKHPTVKPLRLCQYLATLILPPAGFRKLLVPYSGSGSDMVGALQAGWDYVIGIEREAEYVEIAERRLASLDAA